MIVVWSWLFVFLQCTNVLASYTTPSRWLSRGMAQRRLTAWQCQMISTDASAHINGTPTLFLWRENAIQLLSFTMSRRTRRSGARRETTVGYVAASNVASIRVMDVSGEPENEFLSSFVSDGSQMRGLTIPETCSIMYDTGVVHPQDSANCCRDRLFIVIHGLQAASPWGVKHANLIFFCLYSPVYRKFNQHTHTHTHTHTKRMA